MAKRTGTLTKAEMQIMTYLWAMPDCKGTVSDVLACYPDKKPAYTTVATFMKILQQKGFVDFEKMKGSKTQIYFPLITKDEYSRQVLGEVKDSLFGGSFSSLVHFFVKEEKVTEQELKEILDMIETGKE